MRYLLPDDDAREKLTGISWQVGGIFMLFNAVGEVTPYCI